MSTLFDIGPKEDVELKVYPTYTLYGRILTKDLQKFKRTQDESLLIYKFCVNRGSKDRNRLPVGRVSVGPIFRYVS